MDGESAHAPLLSALCQQRAIGAYVVIFMALGAALYGVVTLLSPLLPGAGGNPSSVALVGYQAINFHHYLVDARIWRSGSPATAPAVWAIDGHRASELRSEHTLIDHERSEAL